jgi:hypothetical protein
VTLPGLPDLDGRMRSVTEIPADGLAARPVVHSWSPEEVHRASVYGICDDPGCRTPLDVRVTWNAVKGSSLMERYCPACGEVQ